MSVKLMFPVLWAFSLIGFACPEYGFAEEGGSRCQTQKCREFRERLKGRGLDRESVIPGSAFDPFNEDLWGRSVGWAMQSIPGLDEPESESSHLFLGAEGRYLGRPCVSFFWFVENQLYKADHHFLDRVDTAGDFVRGFNRTRDALRSLFGRSAGCAPNPRGGWFDKCPKNYSLVTGGNGLSDGEAGNLLLTGMAKFESKWKTKKSIIELRYSEYEGVVRRTLSMAARERRLRELGEKMMFSMPSRGKRHKNFLALKSKGIPSLGSGFQWPAVNWRERVRIKAAEDWPGDYSMQKHVLEQNQKAIWSIERLKKGGRVSRVIINEILGNAMKEWPDDYQMQLYEIKKQGDAWLSMQRR